MCRKILMPLLVTVCKHKSGGHSSRDIAVARTVLGNVVKIVTPNDNRPGHLSRDHLAGEDTATNGNIAGEWALFIYMRGSSQVVCTG